MGNLWWKWNMSQTDADVPVRNSSICKTVSLPAAIVAAVEGRIAVKEARNFSDVVTHAVRDWLRNNPPINRERKAG